MHILRKVPAGFDDFVTEKYQDQIEAIFREWTSQLLKSPQDVEALGRVVATSFLGSSLKPSQERTVNESPFMKAWKVEYPAEVTLGGKAFLAELQFLSRHFFRAHFGGISGHPRTRGGRFGRSQNTVHSTHDNRAFRDCGLR